MHEPEHERHDPFGEASLLSDLGQFRPRGEGEARLRPDIDAVEALAAARGFGDRGPGRGQRVKEPTKTLQFRLPESLVEDVSNLLICYPLCPAKKYRDDGGMR